MRPRRACNAPHGTPARYRAGCSCIPCCDAWNTYQAAMPPLTDAALIRSHIEGLHRQMSYRAIAEAAGVSMRGLMQIVWGEHARVRSHMADAILGVDGPAETSRGWIAARNARRLVAKMRTRHTVAEVASACSISRSYVSLLTSDDPPSYVKASTYHGIQNAAVALGVHRFPVDMERFERLRTDGLTDAEVADALGITPRHVQRLEARRRTVA